MRTLDEEQYEILLRLDQANAMLAEATERDEALNGGVTWKTVGDYEYLYRFWTNTETRKKTFKGLGRRDERTETYYEAFRAKKGEVSSERRAIEKACARAAKLAQALGLGVWPTVMSSAVAVAEAALDDGALRVFDAHAIAAYALNTEAMPDWRDLRDRPLRVLVDGDREAVLRVWNERFGCRVPDGHARSTAPIAVDLSTTCRAEIWTMDALAYHLERFEPSDAVDALETLEDEVPINVCAITRDGSVARFSAPSLRALGALYRIAPFAITSDEREYEFELSEIASRAAMTAIADDYDNMRGDRLTM